MQKTFISFFCGKSEMMLGSVFSRRRMNGVVSRLSCATASGSRRVWMGMKKRCRNDACVPRKPGLRRSMIDQRSPTLFSTGVPVRAMRNGASMARAALACLVSAFLTFCASSRMRPFHATRCSVSTSRCSRA